MPYLTPWQWDDGPGFFSTSCLSLKTMSAALADKLRAPKVTHNVTNTRCPLGSLFIRSKHGFWPSEGFFAALPPCQPPILTLHVSNGTPITDQLVFFFIARMFSISKMIQMKSSFHITRCKEIWLIRAVACEPVFWTLTVGANWKSQSATPADRFFWAHEVVFDKDWHSALADLLS